MFTRLLLLAAMALTVTPGVGQKTTTRQLELWHSMGRSKELYTKTLAANGFNEAVIFYAIHIDPDGDHVYDTASFASAVVKYFPNKNETGMGIIDMEDKIYQNLALLPADSVAFQQANKSFLQLVRIGKTLRPNVKWGIYNIPFSVYWNKDKNWQEQGNKMKTLLQTVDVMAISQYDFFPDTTKFTDNYTYHKDNIMMALKYAVQYNKPLYVYVWHRWHESAEKIALELIPAKTFEKHLRWMKDFQYKGVGITGFVWFDATQYFYNTKDNLQSRDAATLKSTKVGNVKDDMVKQYGAIIKKVVGGSQKAAKQGEPVPYP